MPAENFVLPTGTTVRLLYLRKHPDSGHMGYLQSIRTGIAKEDWNIADAYRGRAPHYAKQLARLVAAEVGNDGTAVIAVPSSRADVVPYMKAIQHMLSFEDLSPGAMRAKRVRAATTTSLETLIAEYGYSPAGTENGVRCLVIVDDIVASGRSVAALLVHVRRAGLPGQCRIIVAAPVLVSGTT